LKLYQSMYNVIKTKKKKSFFAPHTIFEEWRKDTTSNEVAHKRNMSTNHVKERRLELKTEAQQSHCQGNYYANPLN